MYLYGNLSLPLLFFVLGGLTMPLGGKSEFADYTAVQT